MIEIRGLYMPKKTYTCSCPDYQNRHDGNVNSRGITSSVPQQWGDTVRNGDCKHIYAVKLKRGELDLDSIPTDIPVPDKIKREPSQGYIGKPKKNHNPFKF